MWRGFTKDSCPGAQASCQVLTLGPKTCSLFALFTTRFPSTTFRFHGTTNARLAERREKTNPLEEKDLSWKKANSMWCAYKWWNPWSKDSPGTRQRTKLGSRPVSKLLVCQAMQSKHSLSTSFPFSSASVKSTEFGRRWESAIHPKARKKVASPSIQQEWQEGAGGMLLLAAAHETALLSQLEKALPICQDPPDAPQAPTHQLFQPQQTLLLTLKVAQPKTFIQSSNYFQ